ILAAISYYFGTRVGFAFTPSGQPNSAFWPANAILLAVFLLTPKKMWWSFFLAVVSAHMLAQLQAGVPPLTSLGLLVTNTSEALIGALCITRFVRPTRVFDSVRGVFIFLVFGVLVAPLATSFLDAAAVVLTGWGHGYLPIGAERFWTNALAELTIVPSIVLCSTNCVSWILRASPLRICEAALLFLSAALVTFLIFGLHPISAATAPALLYVPILLLLWATARFGSGGLSLSLLLTALTSIWYVTHGHQPFPYASLAQNILSLQILLCMI